MVYYTIRLDPDASKICTIIFPRGKYSYKRLPILNPHLWRGERLHHHGGGVCWLFVLLWMGSWCHTLIIRKKWYKNNLKMRSTHYFLIQVGVHHTLGDWKTKQVLFQLRKGVSPYHGWAFPVPKIPKNTIIKEVERLCKFGVLERQPAPEWALPAFIIPKKDRTICFLSNLWEVNKRLARIPFSIPKISTVLQ